LGIQLIPLCLLSQTFKQMPEKIKTDGANFTTAPKNQNRWRQVLQHMTRQNPYNDNSSHYITHTSQG
jgi:hypothetical protein